MALQPIARLAGSSHVLRFQGSLLGGGASPAVASGVVITPAANVLAAVTFFLADLTDLADQTKRLPASVFDDSEPADGAPHATTGGPSGTSGGLPPSGKTWMQNVRVRAVEEFTSSTATPLVANAQVLNPIAFIAANGQPAVSFGIAFTAAGVTALDAAGVPVIVEIEIPSTSTR